MAHPGSPGSPTAEPGPRGHVDVKQPALSVETPLSPTEKLLPRDQVDANQLGVSTELAHSPTENPLPRDQVDVMQSAVPPESLQSPTEEPLPRDQVDDKQSALTPESLQSPTEKPVAQGHVDEHGQELPVKRGAGDDGDLSLPEESRAGDPPTFEELRRAELREKTLREASPRDGEKGLSDDNMPLSRDMWSPNDSTRTRVAQERPQDVGSGPEQMLSSGPLSQRSGHEQRTGEDLQLLSDARSQQDGGLQDRIVNVTESSMTMVIMFSCFCCLLLFNVFVVASLFLEFLLQTRPIPPTEPALKLGAPVADKEQGVHYPLVCGYRCNLGVVNPLPPDGLCDLVFYQLENNDSFINWNKSGCLHVFLPRAMTLGTTRYGLAIFAGQARPALRQLGTSSGVVEFLRLWSMGVKHFGLSFVVGKAEMLASYDFGVLAKLRSLQEMADETTGKQYKRRYLVLGIQAWYGNLESEKEELARIIHNISVTHPMNMLVLYTHILDQRPIEKCVVAGPAIYENSLPLPLPSMVTTLELMGLAKIPETVTVLFSLVVGVAVIQLAGKIGQSTVNYGDACWDVSHVTQDESCKEFHVIEFVDKDIVSIIKPQGISYQPVYLFDNRTTMEIKINLVFDRINRKNFGWSLHSIDRDDFTGYYCTPPPGEHWPLPLIVSNVSRVIRRHRRVEFE